jgi:predicted RNA-binding Zn-ribbon protein involved in translation (DUF1610 family)
LLSGVTSNPVFHGDSTARVVCGMKITDSPKSINRCPRCEANGSLRKVEMISKRKYKTLVCSECGFDVHEATEVEILNAATWFACDYFEWFDATLDLMTEILEAK